MVWVHRYPHSVRKGLLLQDKLFQGTWTVFTFKIKQLTSGFSLHPKTQGDHGQGEIQSVQTHCAK